MRNMKDYYGIIFFFKEMIESLSNENIKIWNRLETQINSLM